jgi:hypothetical protein
MSKLRNIARPKPLLLIWALLQYPIVMRDVWFPEPDGVTACSFYAGFWDTPVRFVFSLAIAASGLWYGKVRGNLLAVACCGDIIYRHFDFVLGFQSESQVFTEDGRMIWLNLLAWWKFLARYNPTYILQILTAVTILICAAVFLAGAIRKQRPVLR